MSRKKWNKISNAQTLEELLGGGQLKQACPMDEDYIPNIQQEINIQKMEEAEMADQEELSDADLEWWQR